MTAFAETIAAIATPAGRGGVGIVRISGPRAAGIAESLLGQCPRPRYASYGPFRTQEGALLDTGIALYFQGPHSFTGDDVLELQGHGGPVVLDGILQAALRCGARLARPGEFSERAFLNGKIDLVQAESVADLIDSVSAEAARMALNSLQGVFSQRIQELVDKLIDLRSYVESAIDFSEDEIDFLTEGGVSQRLAAIQLDLESVFRAASQGTLLREGMSVVIAGRPNAGKSSLLNALAGRDRAIVTEIPGTTRDVLREQIQIDGLPIHIVDTAGLRDSSDRVEQEGIRRAWSEIERADRLILVVDARLGMGEEERGFLDRFPVKVPVTVIYNKIDLIGGPASVNLSGTYTELHLSALSGDGMDLLRTHLKEAVGFRAGEGTFMARRRHLDALAGASEHLVHGVSHLHGRRAGELLAEELRLAQRALGEIVGTFTQEDLLDRIFAQFCIGK